MPYTDNGEKIPYSDNEINILSATFNDLLEEGEEEAIINIPRWNWIGAQLLTEYRITVKKKTITID